MIFDLFLFIGSHVTSLCHKSEDPRVAALLLDRDTRYTGPKTPVPSDPVTDLYPEIRYDLYPEK